MSSFDHYLSLQEDVSKEGQMAQYEKSLERLGKVRGSLSKNGLNTVDIDHQMRQVHSALGRRKSGTHKWHGAFVRIDQEPLHGNMLMWRITGRDGQIFHIPVSDAHGVIKIPANWHQYPNPRKPMNKFVEYRQEVLGNNMINLITYAENRTVDVVPVKTGEPNQYYLIKRRKSGMWATVGGHIDEGELDNPLAAARRELFEETQVHAMFFRQLPMGWIRESIANPDLTPAVEYNSWTLPYIAIVHPDSKMIPSDDASGGGSWFDIGEMPSGLHFNHHKRIIREAFSFLPSLLKQFGKH